MGRVPSLGGEEFLVWEMGRVPSQGGGGEERATYLKGNYIYNWCTDNTNH